MTPRTSTIIARTLWVLSVILGLAGIVLQGMGGSLRASDAWFLPIALLLLLGFPTLGLLIASRRPGNAIGWIFLGVGTVWGLSSLASGYAFYAAATGRTASTLAKVADWSGQWNWMPAVFIPTTVLPLLFPDGRPLSPRWRPVVWGAAICTTVVAVATAFAPGPLEDPVFLRENPFGIKGAEPAFVVANLAFFALFAVFAASLVSLALRLRHSVGEERQQMKWLAYAASVAVVSVAAGFLVGGIFGTDSTTLSGQIVMIASLVAIGLIPMAAGIAILKYRLYDIDLVISRTLVFGLLAAFITAVYAAIVIGVGTAIGGRSSPLLSAVAAAVIALAFQPVRVRARHLANRLVYGKRATPYEVLSEFAGRLANSYSMQDVLPRMAQILADGTGAERAAVWLSVGGELREAASAPTGGGRRPMPMPGEELPEFPPGETGIPVRHRGELLGAVSIRMPPSEPVTPAQERLLSDVASQAGLVLSNVRLIEELRASRQRLVATQDEERRRLERNIHDGAQQQLVALAVKARLARTMAARDVAKAEEMLDDLQTELAGTLDNLRDLARGIYPPLLADKGLAAAIESQARKSPVPVAVETNGVDRYPQDVEAAVYFCTLEALQNVAKYANASRATVQVWAGDEDLIFEVSDDGVGFEPSGTKYGTGLQGMADRLDAIGGTLEVRSAPGAGTTVTGRVPARPVEVTV